MSQTVTGLFDNYEDAKRAVEKLEAAGVHHRDISIVGSNASGQHAGLKEHTAETAHGAAADAGKGAELGAAVGGVGGLLAGVGLLAIPGLGPVVAAGWLVSTLVGAVGGAAVGGAAGGLVGALTHAGVPEQDAHVYAEGVRRGGTLVTAKVPDDMAAEAARILHGEAVDPQERREAYRQQGWSAYDPSAPAYTREQAEAERTRYGMV